MAISIALTTCALFAQAPGTGAYPFSTFDQPGFDSVNIGNLNVRFNIPITTKQGRNLSFNYSIQYEGLVWSNVNGTWAPAPNFGFAGMLNGTTFAGYLTHVVVPAECPSDVHGSVRTTPEWTNFQYHDPFGAVHPFNYDYTFSGCPGQPSGADGDGSSSDGSGYTLLNKATVQTARGVVITPGSSATGQDASSLTDTNGNQITFNGTNTYTDTTGATPLTISGSNPVTFTYPVTNQSNNASTAAASLTYKTYTVRTNFGCSVGEYGSNSVNLVDHITLADGSSYNFAYEGTPGANDGAVTGRLASIVLPTGGTISYSYQGGCSSSGGINADGTVGNLTRVTTDGTRSYKRLPVNGNATQTTLQDEKGNQTVYQFTIATNSSTGFSNFYETHRQVYQGNASGTPLMERFTCFNGATGSCDGQAVTPPLTEADVTTIFNGGKQDLVKNSYDTSSNLLSSSHYTGSTLLQSTQMSYNSLSEITQSTQIDGASNTTYASTSYGYDETSVTGTSGLPQHTSASGTRGNQTSSHIVFSGSSTLDSTTSYYDTGMPVSSTAPGGFTTSYNYDSTGTFVTSTTLPVTPNGTSLVTTASYDASSGAMLSSTGANSGQTTTITQYDALLRPAVTSGPNGGQVQTAYNNLNNPYYTWTLNSKQNGMLSVLYDGYGRQTRTAMYNGQSSNVWYQQDQCYDQTGMLQFVSTKYQGNGFGTSANCSGSGTTYGYDALGRVVSVKTDDGTATTQYQNRAVLYKDVNGVQRITQYDLLGRVSGVCELSGSTLAGQSPANCGMDISGTGYLTSYSYDLANHKVTIMQGSQNRVFQTDAAGRPTLVQEPERGQTAYTYSYNTGNYLTVVRTRPKANQTDSTVHTNTTTYYDALGRPMVINYDDGITPNKNFWYDVPGKLGWSNTPTNPNGNLVSAATINSSNAYITRMQISYDSVNEPTAVWQCAPSICGTGNQESRGPQQSTYDYAGNLVGSYDGASGSISYGRSPAGELTSMTQNSYTDQYNTPNLVSGVTNGPFGPVSYTLGNGLGTAKTYDSMGRGNGVWVCNGSTSPYCNNATQLYGDTGSYSGSRSTGMCDTTLGQCQSHGYDEFNRLISVSGSNSSYTYSYDRYGNRLSQMPSSSTTGPAPSYSFNNANQIVGLPYDAAGNLMGDGISHSFTYDAEGNVLSVDNGSTATYVYDALNHRVSSQTSAGTTEYVYNVQGQRTSSWLVNGSASGFGNEGRIYWDGQQFAYRAWDGTTFFQHKSPLGTDRLRTNYQGLVTGERSLAFGDAFSSDSNDAQGAAQDNDQYAGLEHDQESYSEHATFRQYSSTQGRWMSPDPYDGSYDLTNPQSLNRYSYVTNNPYFNTDPDGTDPNDCGAYGGDESSGFVNTNDYSNNYYFDNEGNICGNNADGSAGVTCDLSDTSGVSLNSGSNTSRINPVTPNGGGQLGISAIAAPSNGRRCIADCGSTAPPDPTPHPVDPISIQIPMEIPIPIEIPWLPWLNTPDPITLMKKSTRWSKFPGCSVQYNNDIDICAQRRTASCWTSAAQRLANCNANGGSVGYPPLSR